MLDKFLHLIQPAIRLASNWSEMEHTLKEDDVKNLQDCEVSELKDLRREAT